MANNNRVAKRIIVCCDGTWMDSDSGYTKPTYFPYHPFAVLQTPSNVTRISRAFKRQGRDGKHQVIYYHSGVGAGGNVVDTMFGGMLGTGLAEAVRESYSFITANYVPGDEIILIGFSRGAFTARSVAGLILDIGLLTRTGMRDFFAVFKDNANRGNIDYEDIFPSIPFKNKPTGPGSEFEYRNRLLENGLTRFVNPDGEKICVHCVAVWDTVGSLGIPNLTLLAKLGLPHSTKEFKFYDTQLHPNINHAFQALALDEHRRPFSPAMWERTGDTTGTDLRQVWFPGTHTSVGGGYADQQVANMSLAWMMDQLSSIGVTFQDEYIDHIYNESRSYYQNLSESIPLPICPCPAKSEKPWATPALYEKCRPVRPFGLGKIFESDKGIWLAAGARPRTPGLFYRVDPKNGFPSVTPMTQTNERIHSSVRVRVALQGLASEDKGLYQPANLLKYWAPTMKKITAYDPVGADATLKWGNCGHCNEARDKEQAQRKASLDKAAGKKKPGWARGYFDGTVEEGGADAYHGDGDGEEGFRWVWEFVGKGEAPEVKVLVEDNLGPYERRLLELDGVAEVTSVVLGKVGVSADVVE